MDEAALFAPVVLPPGEASLSLRLRVPHANGALATPAALTMTAVVTAADAAPPLSCADINAAYDDAIARDDPVSLRELVCSRLSSLFVLARSFRAPPAVEPSVAAQARVLSPSVAALCDVDLPGVAAIFEKLLSLPPKPDARPGAAVAPDGWTTSKAEEWAGIPGAVLRALSSATVNLGAFVSMAVPDDAVGYPCQLPRYTHALRLLTILSAYPDLADPAMHDILVGYLIEGYGKGKRLLKGMSYWLLSIAAGGSPAATAALVRLMQAYPDPQALLDAGGSLKDAQELGWSPQAIEAAAVDLSASVVTSSAGGVATAAVLLPSTLAAASPSPSAAATLTTLTTYMRGCLGWLQQELGFSLRLGRQIDLPAVARWLAALNAANEAYPLLFPGAAPPVPHDLFYNDVVCTGINLVTDYRKWLAGTRGVTPSLFSFCATPFLFSAAAKATVLQVDARIRQSDEYNIAVLSSVLGNAQVDALFKLKVRRSHIVEDALRAVLTLPFKGVLKRPLRVKFEGEEGLDEGGVKKEFFSLLTRNFLLKPEYGMFREAERGIMWFNPDALESVVNFELVGTLLGLAIYNGVLLDIAFPVALYARLLCASKKRRYEPKLADLEDWNGQLAKSLAALLAHSGGDDEDVFGLDFTFAYTTMFGEPKTVELVPGGASTPVTASNKAAYVERLLSWLLVDSIAPQFTAFARGFHNVVDSAPLSWFRPSELQGVVTGSMDLDFEALQGAAAYEAPYSAGCELCVWLWEILHTFTDADKRRFLAFVTGSDRAPVGGLGSLVITVCREGPDCDRLPTARTCFHYLLVPEYTSKAKLEEKLRGAIAESQGFGLI